MSAGYIPRPHGTKRPAPRDRSSPAPQTEAPASPRQAPAPATAEASRLAGPEQSTPPPINLLAFEHPHVALAMGTSTEADLLGAWKSLKLVDAEARRLQVPMPGLKGREFGAGDDAMHAVAYFDSLGQMCNIRAQSEPLESG